jgi:hypothetical protein
MSLRTAITGCLTLLCVGLLGVVLLAIASEDDGRTPTREARRIVRRDYPFLFAPAGYLPALHWHHEEEFQLLVISGRMVFIRRPDAKPNTAAQVRSALLRAARMAHFEQADEDSLIHEDPPASERAWIAAAGPDAVVDVLRRVSRKGDRDSPKYVCRIWIAPDASRYVAAYAMTD